MLRAADAARPASVIYHAQCPYIFSDGQVHGAYQADAPGAVRVALSFDEGKTFQAAWSSPDRAGTLDLDLLGQVSARYAYWLKVDLAPGAAVRALEVRSTFVVSPWALPGRLQRGQNRVTFVGGPVAAPVKTACSWIERSKSTLGVALNTLGFYLDGGRMHRHVGIVAPGKLLALAVTLSGRLPGGEPPPQDGSGLVALERVPANWVVDAVKPAPSSGAAFTVQARDVSEGEISALDVKVGTGEAERRIPLALLVADAALACEAEAAATVTGNAAVTDLPEASGARVVTFTGDGQLTFAATAARAGRHALWLRARWDQNSSTAMELAVAGTAPRKLSADAMIGFSDWTRPTQAHTKMFAHFGEQYAHWSWYRVPDIDLQAGPCQVNLTAKTGAQFDALVLLPQTEAVDRAAMNLFMNWNYAPWRNPL